MADIDFIHLHNHTEYSLLDGASRIETLLAQAGEYKMSSLAITDHGNMFGVIEFYRKAKQYGIKPIIGCEVYIAPKSRHDKKSTYGISNASYHLILLAKDIDGYKNLIKLVSLSYLEGFYYKPRIDKESLSQYSRGLIGLSSCLKGEIPYLLSRERKEEAEKAVSDYLDILGRGNFYLEVQENGIDRQRIVNKEIIELSKKLSLPVVATNDCHYLKKDDARAHDILLCLQTGKTINDKDRMRFQTDEIYFKSKEEMISAFTEIPDAIKNTKVIEEMCNIELSFDEIYLPDYYRDIEDKDTDDGSRERYLVELARNGLNERIKKSIYPIDISIYEERLEEELRIISNMGYAGYFLIVWDIINYARSKGIPVGPGRGSVAGSIAAYSLRITEIDPVRYGLLFERFLNPERVTLPDIDMDFCMSRRGEVIDYVTEKFGSDHVSQIITFGTMAARAVIRDVGRAMEIPYAEVDRVAKMIPNTLNIKLKDAIDTEPRLREMAESDPKINELLTIGISLEGLARHASTHAAGVVISKEPITEHVPLFKGSKDEVVTQYAKDDIERIGLVKFDFLGLRTLTVIDQAVKLINKVNPNHFDISSIPLDDEETYKLFSSGNTIGVFQLESSGMIELLTRLKPERFEDIIAILALYRPGPIGSGMIDDFIKRKRGSTPIKYEVPELEEVLKETYGVIVYQEQVMKIANSLAGFSLADADILRRAMGKKKPEEMERQKELFVKGMQNKGGSEKKARKIFDLMAYFAGYGFNKSHSAAYALISYQTAYLKANYPKEFMTALLTSEMGNPDKVVRYINECREMGIKVLPPDINESRRDFTLVEEGIRFGLAAIKNVGKSAIDSIISVKEKGERFASIFDLCRRIDLRKVNRRVIEGLIKAGALNSMGAKRSQMMEVLDRAIDNGVSYQKDSSNGQISLFEMFDNSDDISLMDEKMPELPEWDETTMSRYEKEALGFYITTHPLVQYEAEIKRISSINSENINKVEEGKEVRICGIIGNKKITNTKKGKKMAYIQVEDLYGALETIIFPDLFKTSSHLLDTDSPILITGSIDRSEKGVKFKATNIELLSERREKTVKRVDISIDISIITNNELKLLRETLLKYKGNCRVYLRCLVPVNMLSTIAVNPDIKISPSDSCISEIEKICGKGMVSFC
ncbi:MAG: DNA polymerase III subunit alpha [Nitrospirota bacterium]